MGMQIVDAVKQLENDATYLHIVEDHIIVKHFLEGLGMEIEDEIYFGEFKMWVLTWKGEKFLCFFGGDRVWLRLFIFERDPIEPDQIGAIVES